MTNSEDKIPKGADTKQTPVGEALVIQPQAAPVPVPVPEPVKDVSPYIGLLELMNQPRVHVTTAPTNAPRNFAQQIVFYDDGVNRRLYLYINNTWRYVVLT